VTKVHRSLLVDILLPLHEPNQMLVWGTQEPLIGSYHEALVACLVPFLEREADLVQTVLEAIVAAWPQGFDSNTPKEVMLLHEVGTLFKFVRPDRCGAGLHVVMPKILECLRVDNSRVVERALFLFKDDDFMELLGRQTGQVMEPLVSALLRGGEPCWNPTVTKAAHVLESLEKLDPETFASACETLWGAGTSPVADVTLDSAEKESVPSVPSAQVSVTPKASGTADHPLPPTTLAAAMGTWRPPAKDGIRQPGAPKVAQNPPATITGVAPWAFQTAPPSGASRVARGVKSSRMSGQGKTLPPYTLKRPLPCDSAVPDVSDNRAKTDSSRRRTPEDIRGVEREDENENISAWRHGRGEKVETVISGGRPGPTRKTEEVYQESSEGGTHTVNDTSSGKRTGAGLRRVREFIQELKPKHVEGQAGSWREQQLEPTPTLLPDLRFHDLVFGHELGQGSFSSVKYARQITKGRPQGDWPEFAVKIISTTKIKELHYEKSVTNEIACLRVLSHPGIARLISAFRWRDGAYLVLEYASRGDLHTHIKQHGSLSEVSARLVVSANPLIPAK
ncbi:unnamed protein product, partial [Sphacelaria rigidula]